MVIAALCYMSLLFYGNAKLLMVFYLCSKLEWIEVQI